jgi:3-oxoacyl-[acyl-carrier protein] reductase
MKHILVTGGSQGLGLATVKRLLSSGWRVTAIQRTISLELEKLLKDFPDQLNAFCFDLGNAETIEQKFREEWFPDNQPIDGLVNNSAIAYDDIISNLDLDLLTRMLQVNVVAAMILSKAVIRRLILHRHPGSLVHISSICAHTGYKGLAMYAASKGAIEAFSRTLAREWGNRDIRSNCVVPGFMETAMSQSLSQEQRDRIYRRTALQAATSVDSVAATIEFLLSEGSHSITGQNIVVDSGTI